MRFSEENAGECDVERAELMGTTDSEVITERALALAGPLLLGLLIPAAFAPTKNHINPGANVTNVTASHGPTSALFPPRARVLIGDSCATRNIEDFDCERQSRGTLRSARFFAFDDILYLIRR